MAKIKITNAQAAMLKRVDESTPSKKILLKVTQEQYNRLINEVDIKGGHARVDKNFKQAFTNSDVQNLGEETFDIKKPNTQVPKLDKKIMNNPIKEQVGEELRTHVLQLVQDMYTNPSQVGLDEYWKKNGTEWSEMSDYLMRLGLVNQTDDGYTVARRVNERVFNTPAEAVQTIQDSIDTFLKKKNRMKSSMEESNYPPGTDDFDKSAPWNQDEFKSQEPDNNQYDIVAMNNEIAILKSNDGLFVFYYFDIDKSEFAQYAEDVYDIDGTAIKNYVNSNPQLSMGVGLMDFENGKDIVKIDDSLKNELLNIYDKDKNIIAALSSIDETQGEISPVMKQVQDKVQNPFPQYKKDGDKDAIKAAIQKLRDKELASRNPNVIPIDEDPTNDFDSEYETSMDDNLSDIEDYHNNYDDTNDDDDDNGLAEYIVPEWAMSALINDDYSGLEDEDIEKIQAFRSQVADAMGNAHFMLGDEQQTDLGFKHRNDIDNLGANCSLVFINPNNTMSEMTSAGSAATGGSSGPFVGPMNQQSMIKKTPTIAETTDSGSSGPYDANALPNISRDGTFKKGTKTKAQANTQYPKGTFVGVDDCTKLNNNKKAINGGCSSGAADNVVKQTKSSKSIISPSLDENIIKKVALQTGKSIKEVTRILNENSKIVKIKNNFK